MNILRWYLKRLTPETQWWKGVGEPSIRGEDNRIWIIETWADDGTRLKEEVSRKPSLPKDWIVRGGAQYTLRPEKDGDPFRHCLIAVYGSPDSPAAVLSSGP